jgi:hypothetical protein
MRRAPVHHAYQAYHAPASRFNTPAASHFNDIPRKALWLATCRSCTSKGRPPKFCHTLHPAQTAEKCAHPSRQGMPAILGGLPVAAACSQHLCPDPHEMPRDSLTARRSLPPVDPFLLSITANEKTSRGERNRTTRTSLSPRVSFFHAAQIRILFASPTRKCGRGQGLGSGNS